MCSIATLNPIWISAIAFVAIVGIMAANFNELLYFFLKVCSFVVTESAKLLLINDLYAGVLAVDSVDFFLFH